MSDATVNALLDRLQKVTARLEAVEKQLASGAVAAPAASSSAGGSGETSEFVAEYNNLINEFVTKFAELSKQIDPLVGQQAELFLQAVNAQRDMLQVAAQSKKPSDAVLQQVLKPTSDLIGEITSIKDKNRASKFFNYLSAVAEGVPALGWVVVSPTPGPHVADMRGGSEFYSNRILKEAKDTKNQVALDWVANFNGFLKELQPYIKKYHTTGLTWNPKGGDASAAAPAPPAGGPPPPPGPPPPAPPPLVETSSGGGGPDMSAVFAALNKGENVTSGLKKVTNDMKTKNRTDKSSVVPAAATEKKTTSSAPAGAKAVNKPPKIALEGNKWAVEYIVDKRDVVISDTEVKQTVYIYKCKNATIQIKGKVNAITVDDCQKTAIVFENVVASFEVVNCNSVEIQAIGKVPSFAIDKTSGIQLYLSKECLDAEIVTAKSSEMNVLLPGKTPDEDMVEIAIPEQYKTVVKDNKLHTEIVAHV